MPISGNILKAPEAWLSSKSVSTPKALSRQGCMVGRTHGSLVQCGPDGKTTGIEQECSLESRSTSDPHSALQTFMIALMAHIIKAHN